MIIIVEGIDRVGKSTLCDMLHTEGYKLLDSKIHTSPFSVTSDIFDRLQEERTVAQAQLLTLLDVSEKIVIDRFHLSQIVYGAINRHRDTQYHMLRLEEMLVQNSILVYIRPTDITESNKQHGSNLEQHLAYFDKLFEESKLYKIYGTFDDLTNIVNVIKEIENGN